MTLAVLAGCSLQGADLSPDAADSTGATDGSSIFNGSQINAIYGSAQVSTFAGAVGSASHVDGMGAAARLYGPEGMGFNGTSIYVAEPGSHTLRSLDPLTAAVGTAAGTAFSPGFSASQLGYPRDVEALGGQLFVSEPQYSIIGLVLPPVHVVGAGIASNMYGYVDGPAASARFWGPSALVAVGTDLYIADSNNHVIRRFDTLSGMVTTFAGKFLEGKIVDGPAAQARFLGPQALATDGISLFVGEVQSFKIRKISLATGTVTTLSGVGGLSGQVDGAAAQAQFGIVTELLYSGGSIYVSDAGNHSIRKVNAATGDVSTVAGRRDHQGFSDGAGSIASFNRPVGLALAAGALFVSDSRNHVIRRITGF